MAVDQHAIAAFYSDGTYIHETWANCDNIDPREIVSIYVFHVRQAGNQPGGVKISGHDDYGVQHTGAGLIVKQLDYTPQGVTQHFFKEDMTIQELGKSLTVPIEGSLASSGLQLKSMDTTDPNFNTLDADADTKSNELRTATAPGSGTYSP